MLLSREYPGVYIKDEGLNPTGSFKARGMSAAVTMARAYGLKKWRHPLPATPPAPWPRTVPLAELKPTSSCRKTFRSRTGWSAKAMVHTSTLVDGLISDWRAWSASAWTAKAGSTFPR